MKLAVLVAGAIVVNCPHCGEPQPAPDNGSDLWMIEQVRAQAGPRQCVSCDGSFNLAPQRKVVVSS